MNQKSQPKRVMDLSIKEWEMKSIGDCCKLVKKQFKPSKENIKKYVGLEHIEQQSLRLVDIGSSEDITSNKFEFKEGQILFGRLRPYFRKVYRPKFEGICSTDIWVIDTNEGNDQSFFFYFFANDRIITEATNSSDGTRMPRAKWDYLEKLRFPVPSFQEQKSIAKIFSDLDSKIELNNHMNKTLDKISKTIFEHWFIDFEFPDEENKPYSSNDGEMVDSIIGKIPKDWHVKPFGDIANMVKGMSYSSEEKTSIPSENIFVTLNNISEDGKFKPEYYWIVSDRIQEKNLLSEGELVIANIHFGVGGSTTGRLLGCPALSIFPYNYKKTSGVFSTDLTKISPFRKEIKYYLYFVLRETQQDTASRFRTGTSILHLDHDDFIKNKMIVEPPKSILDKFNSIFEPFFYKITLNYKENMVLTEIRDSLIPKLMSGKIRVPVEA